MASLTLFNIEKSFGASKVIKGVNLDIKDGEFVVFVGPSGCGKSTLLRIIAGLEDATSGTISIGQSVVNDVAPSKRGVSMVFQSYALYPHMTVRQNMAFGLKQVKTPSAIIQEKVQNAADILQLSELLDRYPKNLSGGQRQRVAIGRAIVRDPEVFLFDEPLSNLDADLRGQTRTEIAKLHQDLYATMIYVTHDQIEAMTLADKIVVLRSGQVEQIGSPQELYEAPKNTFVAQFIGSPKMNLFSSKDTVLAPDGKKLGVRPEHMELADKDTSFRGVVDFVEYLGETKLAHCKMDSGTTFIAKISPEHALLAGENVGFKANTANFHHFDEATGQRLADDKKTSP